MLLFFLHFENIVDFLLNEQLRFSIITLTKIFLQEFKRHMDRSTFFKTALSLTGVTLILSCENNDIPIVNLGSGRSASSQDPFSKLTQKNLDKFKTMFPKDTQLQRLSLKELVEYSKGKDNGGYAAVATRQAIISTKSSILSPCQIAVAGLVIDCVLVVSGAIGIHGKVSASAIEQVAKAIEPQLSEIEKIAGIIANSPSSYDKAKGIFGIVKVIYSAGMIEAVYSALVSSLTWWDMVLYGVLGMAELIAVFVTDGLATIALIAAEMAQIGFVVSDSIKVADACGTTVTLAARDLNGSWTLIGSSSYSIILSITAADVNATKTSEQNFSISGRSSVNQYSGKLIYKTNNQPQININSIVTTRTAGPVDAMKFESDYLIKLGAVTRYELTKQNQLKLYYNNGVLVYDKK